MELNDFFRINPRAAIAFSGGVDSSYLLSSAKKHGCAVGAYFIKSQLQPEFELSDAVFIARNLKVPLTVVECDILCDEKVAQNPPDRCYHCKRLIFSKLREYAERDGFSVLCDGTNADDDESDRPGMRALRELGVMSPLRECGLSKEAIRRLSEQDGLPVHSKPSYACLATRVPAGIRITAKLLEKIERSENALFDMGFSDFRVRFLPPDGARLQFPAGQISAAAGKREEILAALRPDFNAVLLDFEPR